MQKEYLLHNWVARISTSTKKNRNCNVRDKTKTIYLEVDVNAILILHTIFWYSNFARYKLDIFLYKISLRNFKRHYKPWKEKHFKAPNSHVHLNSIVVNIQDKFTNVWGKIPTNFQETYKLYFRLWNLHPNWEAHAVSVT